ncbi:MAG: redoxin domain-containing protein [Bacteroidetes bacterium]|nr:redoxin domain-containing protein [Bacteroidota bacterium]
MNLAIGQSAPEFSLFNTEKTKISLTDFKGKNVIILFFPLAFSGVCTKEMCSVQENFSAYQKLNAEIIGISVDSLFTLNKFKQEYHLDFNLLSDFNKETATLYNCLFETFVFEMSGVAKRSTFVLDKEGTIRFIEILESAGDLPDFDAIQNCLKELNA